MEKRMSNRKTSKLLAGAAVAGLGLAGMTQTADAALVVELRALTATGGTVAPDGKSVQLSGASGQVRLGVFATITGANSTVDSADRDGDSIPDLQNDEALGIVTGSLRSSAGGLLGSYAIPPDQNDINFNPINSGSRVIPFAGSGSSNGVLSDLDSDGDLDVGSLANVVDSMFSARSLGFSTPSGPYPFTVLVQMSSAGLRSFAAGQGAAHPGLDDGARTSASGSTFRIGTFLWNVTGGDGLTELSYIPRPDTTQGTALWVEDGIQRDPGNGGQYLTGAPVTIATTVIPEPATLGLLGMAGLGLLARRRKA